MRIEPHLTGDMVAVVAEISSNHEGDPERARRMAEAAALLGRKLTVGRKMGELSATTDATGRPRKSKRDQGHNPSR